MPFLRCISFVSQVYSLHYDGHDYFGDLNHLHTVPTLGQMKHECFLKERRLKAFRRLHKTFFSTKDMYDLLIDVVITRCSALTHCFFGK